MVAQLERIGLPYVRQDGVLGFDIPPSLRRNFFDSGANLVCTLKKGEAGCFASHLLVSGKLTDGQLGDIALVLEDDMVLPNDIIELVNEIINKIPADWEIVRLCGSVKRASVYLADLLDRRYLVRFSRVPLGAGAYLINKSGARKLLRLSATRYGFDEELRQPWNMGLNTYGVVPPPVTFGSFPSTIDGIEGRPARKRIAWADLWNLHRRIRFNIAKLGLFPWGACLAANTYYKVLNGLRIKRAKGGVLRLKARRSPQPT